MKWARVMNNKAHVIFYMLLVLVNACIDNNTSDNHISVWVTKMKLQFLEILENIFFSQAKPIKRGILIAFLKYLCLYKLSVTEIVKQSRNNLQ